MLTRFQAVGLAVVTLALTSAACGSTRSSDPGQRIAPAERNVITHKEISQAEPRATALQMVERFRPHWLKGRGPIRPSSAQPALVVYVNSQKHGGVATLQRFTVSEIDEIRYLDAMEATRVFGTGHMVGAILLTTRGSVR
jgi:hypothetical protein